MAKTKHGQKRTFEGRKVDVQLSGRKVDIKRGSLLAKHEQMLNEKELGMRGPGQTGDFWGSRLQSDDTLMDNGL